MSGSRGRRVLAHCRAWRDGDSICNGIRPVSEESHTMPRQDEGGLIGMTSPIPAPTV